MRTACPPAFVCSSCGDRGLYKSSGAAAKPLLYRERKLNGLRRAGLLKEDRRSICGLWSALSDQVHLALLLTAFDLGDFDLSVHIWNDLRVFYLGLLMNQYGPYPVLKYPVLKCIFANFTPSAWKDKTSTIPYTLLIKKAFWQKTTCTAATADL